MRFCKMCGDQPAEDRGLCRYCRASHPSAAPAGSVKMLVMDHSSWTGTALMMTPTVAILIGASARYPEAVAFAGFATGVWTTMWIVIGWAWLTRRQSPNRDYPTSG